MQYIIEMHLWNKKDRGVSMDTIYDRISKEKINTLEVEHFPGTIHVIKTEEEASKAIDFLMTYKYLGFDTETRPVFKKGFSRSVSLIQISTEQDCFLFRVNLFGIPQKLINLFESTENTIIGLSLQDDFSAMRRSKSEIHQKLVIDIQKYVKPFGIKDQSLQKIYALIFNKKITKGQRLSNWEADELTPKQQEYAAIDAWACLRIYNFLENNHVKAVKNEEFNDIPKTK